MMFLPKMLHILEVAIQNPTDKAAVQLAADALAVAAEAGNLPSVIKFEKDYDVYRATLPPAPNPVDIANQAIDQVTEQNGGRASGANRGGLMAPGT